MYGNADELVAFRLMPLEAKFQKPIDAHWSYKILDMDRRLLAFQDESTGKSLPGAGISAMAPDRPSSIRFISTKRPANTS